MKLTKHLLKKSAVAISFLGVLYLVIFQEKRKVLFHQLEETYFDVFYENFTDYVTDDGAHFLRLVENQEADYYLEYRLNKKGIPKGKVRAYYRGSGHLYWEGNALAVDPFLPDGECITYYERGTLKSIKHYKEGFIHGDFKTFYEGPYYYTKQTGTYRYGLRHGLFRNYSEALNMHAASDAIFLNDSLFLQQRNLRTLYDSLSEEEMLFYHRSLQEGESFLSEGRVEEAHSIFSQLDSLLPGLVVMDRRLGETNFLFENYVEGFSRLNKYDNNRYTDYRFSTGDAADFKLAYFLGASKIYADTGYMATNNLKAAIDMAPDTDEGNSVKMLSHYLIGYDMTENQSKEAIEHLDQAIAIDSMIANIYVQRALAKYHSYDVDSAKETGLRDIQTAIALGLNQEELAEAFAIRGMLNLKDSYEMDNVRGVVDMDIVRAMGLNPLDPFALKLFADYYEPLDSRYTEIESDQSSGSFFVWFVAGLLLWEAYTVIRLISAGRYLAAAGEVAVGYISSEAINQVLEDDADDYYDDTGPGLTKDRLLDSLNMEVGNTSELDLPSLYIEKTSNSLEEVVAYSNRSDSLEVVQTLKVGEDRYVIYDKIKDKNKRFDQTLYYTGDSAANATRKFEWERYRFRIELSRTIRYQYDQFKEGRIGRESLQFEEGQWHMFGCSIPNNGIHQITFGFPNFGIRWDWEKDLMISDIAYGNGEWVVSQGGFYEDQILQVHYDFPGEAVKEYWNQGYDITQLKFSDGLWILLMSTKPYSRRVNTEEKILLSDEFPWAKIARADEQGFEVESMSHGRGQWAIVLSKEVN